MANRINLPTDYGRPDCINLAGFFPDAGCLGPGRRAILWVQGCLLNCAGCIAAYMRPLEDRHWITVSDAAQRILSIPGIEGITVVGGEPMLQAAALNRLCRRITAKGNLGVMVYTGYSLEDLKAAGHPDVALFLGAIDLLVDGPYLPDTDHAQKWRGSENQRLHFLTPRYRDWHWVVDEKKRDVELHWDEDGRYLLLGIPPKGLYDMLP